MMYQKAENASKTLEKILGPVAAREDSKIDMIEPLEEEPDSPEDRES